MVAFMRGCHGKIKSCKKLKYFYIKHTINTQTSSQTHAHTQTYINALLLSPRVKTFQKGC